MVGSPITWILVADGGRARVLVNYGVGKGVHELQDSGFVGEHRRNQDIQADKPGRTFDSAGQGRHAMEPRTDPHRHEQREFLSGVVDWLGSKSQDGVFDRLVLIAAPHALGDLRGLLPKALADKVVGDLAKDLTRASAAEIEEHLGDVLAV